MKRRKATSKRRRLVVKTIENRMIALIRTGHRHTKAFDDLDKRLERHLKP